MQQLKFHLAQVAYALKQLKEWGTGLYPADTNDKHEFQYHLNILMNLISIADPKYKEGMQRRKEKMEELKKLEREERARQKKLKKQQEQEEDAEDWTDGEAETDSEETC